MRILLTGGAGFIGSHLAERLLEAGHSLAILDDCNDFYDPRLKTANLALVQKAGSVQVFLSDIRDTTAVDQAMATFVPEIVIHLAARAGVGPSVAQPLLYEQVNSGGTAVLLDSARRHGVNRFLFASSSSVYGANSVAPFREDQGDLLPLSPYAATKIAGEKMAYAYSHLYGMRVVCLRLFTVYGPRQRPDLAIRKFAERILSGQPIEMYGDGTTGRDYTYVSDTVDALLAALTLETPFEIINVGGSKPVLLQEMIAGLEKQLGRRANIIHRPLPAGDMLLTCADTEKARRLLGFQAQVDFQEGLRRTVEWMGGGTAAASAGKHCASL